MAEQRLSAQRNGQRLTAAQLQPGKTDEKIQMTEERLAEHEDSKRQVRKVRQKPQEGGHLKTNPGVDEQPSKFEMGQHAQTFDHRSKPTAGDVDII